MHLTSYSVYDSKMKLYLPPFFTERDEIAVRSFCDLAIDPNHTFGRHPADFTLFKIGIFDQETGILEDIPKEPLGTALEMQSRYIQPPLALFQQQEKTNGS